MPQSLPVDFWFDPICPWTWITARWVQEVAPLRKLDVRWHVMSLAVLNDGRDLSPEYAQRMTKAWGPVRLLVAAEQRFGAQVLLPLYTALATRYFYDKTPPGRELVESALDEIGLPLELANAMESTDYDDALRASHQRAIDLVGTDVGTPVISVGGASFFGPVITRIPRGEDACRLWDGLLLLSETDGFYELKRKRDQPPNFD